MREGGCGENTCVDLRHDSLSVFEPDPEAALAAKMT